VDENGKIKIIVVLTEENQVFAIETHFEGPTYIVAVVTSHIRGGVKLKVV
jgi:hypothetical protein